MWRRAQRARTSFSTSNDLDNKGYVATGLKEKIDGIRQRGNVANHDLPASSEDDAHRTLNVTRHLLISVYELPQM